MTIQVVILCVIVMSRMTKQEVAFLRYLQNISSLKSPGSIETNISMNSSNGNWRFILQDNGNLELRDRSEIVFWSSNTIGKGSKPYKLNLQDDGNLVLYDTNLLPTWASNTNNKSTGPFNLSLQNDGNLVLYDFKGLPTFATNTNYAPTYPPAGCVWLFTECNFKGVKKEYCADFQTLDSSTSSILLPESSVDCSSQSNCISLVGKQSFDSFTKFDNPQNSVLNIEFDGYGFDFYIGIFSADKQSSNIYTIIYGGWSNTQTKVFKEKVNGDTVCSFNIGVANPNDKTSYKLIIDKKLGTITMNANGKESFNCKIPNMNVIDLNYYAFASYLVGPKICTNNSSNPTTTGSNCTQVAKTSVKVFSQQNYSGTDTLTISNPIVCLKSLNFDKRIASIQFLNKNCRSNQYSSNGQCLDCPTKCTSCEGPNKCTTCESSLSVNTSTGLCGISCPLGQYDNNGICSDCSTNCATCTSYNKCTSCKNTQRINSLQMCEPDCPPTKYAYKDNCIECASKCLTCLNDQMCLSCYGNAILTPLYKCDLGCASNEYKNNSGVCSRCPTGCSTCIDSNTCTSCVQGLIYNRGQCISECPSGSLKNKNNCYTIVNCPDGMFQDFNNSGECSQCANNCLKCVSKNACYKCDGNFNLIGFDSETKKFYEVSAETGVGLDGPSISFGVKYGQETNTSIKIGSSSCTTPEQVKLLSGYQSSSSSSTGIIIGVIIGVVILSLILGLFFAYKYKYLCWKENNDNPNAENQNKIDQNNKDVNAQYKHPANAAPLNLNY
jgi:hypothetical protein